MGQDRVLHLTPAVRWTLRVGGIVLAALGLWLFSAPLRAFPPSIDSPGFGFSPMEPFLGVLLFFAGSALLSFGLMKATAEITATETARAVEVAGGALGRGLHHDARGEPEDAGSSRRCRWCGSREHERARFCSLCGNGL